MRHAGMIALASLLLCGCPSEPPSAPVDAGPQVDADLPSSGGLVFRFESRPSVPGDTEGSSGAHIIIERAALHLASVRAIGDAANGEDATLAPWFEIEWGEDQGPAELRFPRAPPGLYAQLRGDIELYEITGTIEIEDASWPFSIGESVANLEFTMGLDQVVLEPGMTREVELKVDLDDVVRAIDWDALPEDEEGWLRVDGSSDRIEEVQDLIEDALEDAEQEVEGGSSSDLSSSDEHAAW